MKKIHIFFCTLAIACISHRGFAQKTGAKEASKQPDFAFFESNVPLIQIDITQRDIDQQRTYQWQEGTTQPRPVASVTVREGTNVLKDVSFHLKGAMGSFRPIDDVPSITLGFDAVDKKQRFHGFEKISLNHSPQDPSLMSEEISRQLYEKAGVPVPKAFHARVHLNGRDLGLYVLVEGWTKQFLRRHFENPNGTLYDVGFVHDIDRPMVVNSSDKKASQADLAALTSAIKDPDLTRRAERVAKLLDVKEFIDLQVMDSILWNWDGYAMNRNNYRIYHDPKSDKLVFMPHGLDQLFQDPGAPLMPGGPGLVAKAVYQVPEWRKLYLERMATLLGQIDAAEVSRNIEQLAEQLKPYSPSVTTLAQRWSSRMTARFVELHKQVEASHNLLTFEDSATVALTHWTNHSTSGKASFQMTGNEGHIVAAGATSSAWITTVWLTEGRYRLEGRAQVQDVHGQMLPSGSGAGFKVSSSRKKTNGNDWNWLPHRYASDTGQANILPPIGKSQRLSGSAGWTPIKYDFEVHQPVTDLRLSCELNAIAGDASFDMNSLRLVRLGSLTPGLVQPARR